MPKPLPVRPAHPHEQLRAFQLLFRHAPEEDRAGRVQNALRLMRQGELDPDGVLVVADGTNLLGALVCLPVPGASGLLWPPQAVPESGQEAIEDQLLAHAIGWLRRRGAKLGQSLLAGEETHLALSLERHGFRLITGLWYLRHHLERLPRPAPSEARLTLQTYRRCDRDRFHQTLLRSYEQTRDCPEVSGLRTLEEILEGHQAQGFHDPDHWWLALRGDQPVGVLLVAELSESQGWDLSYLGVVPDARRHGVGRALVGKALAEARAAGAVQLTLAVDARNRPAWNLYLQQGFEPFERREVYLAVWTGPSPDEATD